MNRSSFTVPNITRFGTWFAEQQLLHCTGILQPSVCRIIERVSRALAKRKPQFIKFSYCGLQDVKRQFKNIGSIPGVVGCIDCSHILISSPGDEEAEIFCNRKDIFW